MAVSGRICNWLNYLQNTAHARPNSVSQDNDDGKVRLSSPMRPRHNATIGLIHGIDWHQMANKRRLTLPLLTKATLLVSLIIAGPFYPGSTLAQCVCGFDDGIFTLTTIVVDGDTSDWASVLGDPDNNVCDGPSGGIPDLDAPVQSTGRDIAQFAFTWDATSVYLFTERVGSQSNAQQFIYYADTDNDGLMETGEPVVGVSWKGSNRNVDVSLFSYVSDDPAGDPMVDGGGLADGYTLPGSFVDASGGTNPVRSGAWGSADGLNMEFSVSWAELGLAPGTPFTFHVSSTNSSLDAANIADKIDDNLSGCGGGSGSSQFAALTFIPNLTLSGKHLDAVVAAHTLTNDGNGDDIFDLASVIAGDHTPTVSYYRDADASGDLSAGDFLLTDTDADLFPDTGLVAAGQTVELLIIYEIGFVSAFDPMGIATIVTTATSSFDTLSSQFVTDTVEIILAADLILVKSVVVLQDPVSGMTDPKAIPGAIVLYTITVSNQGGIPADLNTTILTDKIPANSSLLVSDIAGGGSGPVSFSDGSPASGLTYTFTSLGSTTDDLEFSDDGGATFNYTPVPDIDGADSNVTDIRISP